MSITLEWRGDQRFAATTPSGVEIALDGDGEDGISPTESLLAALAACMAIDVVDILTKGRQVLTGCRVAIRGTRREEPPRRFTAMELDLELTGTGLSRSKAERAVALSRETYCSVWHTLDPDLDLRVAVELLEAPDGG